MSLTAQAGIFGFGPAAAKGEDATAFYRTKVLDMDVDVNDDVREGPLEIGAGPFPSFPYKAGYTIGGGCNMQLRLKDIMGWMLYAHFGKCQSVQVGGTQEYKHTFSPDDTDLSYVRYLTLRKYVPKTNNIATSDMGFVLKDCKPINMVMTLAQDAPLTTRWDFQGLDFELVPDTSVWAWENASYEDWKTVPVGCEVGGYVKVTGGGFTGEELKIIGAQMAFVNQPLPVQQERVYGSPYLDDVTVITRRAQVTFRVKWNNPEIYMAALSSQKNGTTWSPRPFTGSFEVAALSSELIGNTLNKHRLIATGNNAMWRLNAPIALAAGQTVIMDLVTTMLEPETGDYFKIDVYNAKTGYTWPSPSSGS